MVLIAVFAFQAAMPSPAFAKPEQSGIDLIAAPETSAANSLPHLNPLLPWLEVQQDWMSLCELLGLKPTQQFTCDELIRVLLSCASPEECLAKILQQIVEQRCNAFCKLGLLRRLNEFVGCGTDIQDEGLIRCIRERLLLLDCGELQQFIIKQLDSLDLPQRLRESLKELIDGQTCEELRETVRWLLIFD